MALATGFRILEQEIYFQMRSKREPLPRLEVLEGCRHRSCRLASARHQGFARLPPTNTPPKITSNGGGDTASVSIAENARPQVLRSTIGQLGVGGAFQL